MKNYKEWVADPNFRPEYDYSPAKKRELFWTGFWGGVKTSRDTDFFEAATRHFTGRGAKAFKVVALICLPLLVAIFFGCLAHSWGLFAFIAIVGGFITIALAMLEGKN